MRYTITTSFKLPFLLAFEHITKITKGNMLTKSNLLIRIIFVILFKCIVALSNGQANVQQIGPNYFVAGVNTEQFNYVAANSRQRANNWCWAACIQMVLNYHGLYITQEDIVRQCYGGLYDAPGGYEQFSVGLNRPCLIKWYSEILRQVKYLDKNGLGKHLQIMLPMYTKFG
jgi:hypothetical protein